MLTTCACPCRYLPCDLGVTTGTGRGTLQQGGGSAAHLPLSGLVLGMWGEVRPGSDGKGKRPEVYAEVGGGGQKGRTRGRE